MGTRPASDNHLGQPHVVESSARAFQRDLYFYWSTVRANPLSLTQEGRLYKRDLKLVNAALLQQVEIGNKNELDFARLLFLRLLLTDLGLLQSEGSTLRAVEKPAFLEQDAAERIQACYSRWREGSFWNEVLSIPNVIVHGAPPRLGRAPEQLAQARKCVTEHLAALHSQGDTAPQWMSIERLIESIRSSDYEFLLPRDYFPFHSIYYRTYETHLSHASPYITYGNAMGWGFSPPFKDEAEGWQVIEAGFIRAVLLEPLHWMGLLDIGYVARPSADGREAGASGIGASATGASATSGPAAADALPVAYRLTPAGAWVLGVGPEIDMPEGQGRVVVQPNFELFALDPISDLTLSRLDEFADRISGERAIKYRLTRKSLYRAQKKGWTAARVLDVLGKLNQPAGADEPTGVRSLPQNIVRSLQEWQGLHERVTIHRRANLLQAANSDLLAQLTQNPSIRSHLVDSSGGNTGGADTGEKLAQESALALISPALGETEELVRALERIDHPPLRTRSRQDAVRPILTIPTGDGPSATGLEVQFHVALPSLYTFEQIEPFTQQDERGRTYLTQSTVGEAVQEGLSVEEILARVRALYRGPLPHAVERQIRAWGHYYGDAAVQSVTLIQVQDGKTLNELLAEPEVRALVEPFVPDPSKALALLDPQDLDQLYEVLARYGIDIHDQLAQAGLTTTNRDDGR